VRIGAYSFAVDLLPKAVELLFAQAPLEKGAGVETGRGMPLKVDQITAVGVIRPLEEVVEADIVERHCRGKTGDMHAQLAAAAGGAHDHGHGVPANDRADTPLHGAVAGHGRLTV